MGRLNRIVGNESVVEIEGETNGQTETEETVQIVDEPIRTSGLSANMPKDKIQLKCNRCDVITSFTRNLVTNLLCPKCGCDNFFALSEFRMEGPDGGIAISLHDKVTRRSGPWKLV